MAQSFENPFQEKRSRPKWIYYGTIIGFVISLMIYLLQLQGNNNNDIIANNNSNNGNRNRNIIPRHIQSDRLKQLNENIDY